MPLDDAHLLLPNTLLGRTRAWNTLGHDGAAWAYRLPLARGLRFRVFAILDLLNPNFTIYELVDICYHDWTLDVHERERWCRIAESRKERIVVT
jgi:hypothetical protein